MKTIVTTFFLLVLTACTGDEPKNQVESNTAELKPDYTILALGDSLTEGLGVTEELAYPSQLKAALQAKGYKNIEVVNAGLSGETTSGLKNRLNWVLKQKPDMTILNIGANDAMRGLPLELTQSNLNEIIQTILDNESQLILAGMEIYDNLGREYVEGFKDIYPQLSNTYNLPLIPFFLQDVAGLADLNQADMIHPNAKGYSIIVKNNILPVVLQQLPKDLKKD